MYSTPPLLGNKVQLANQSKSLEFSFIDLKMQRVAIAGGGIGSTGKLLDSFFFFQGGLTAANAFRKVGIKSVVVEKAPKFRGWKGSVALRIF